MPDFDMSGYLSVEILFYELLRTAIPSNIQSAVTS